MKKLRFAFTRARYAHTHNGGTPPHIMSFGLPVLTSLLLLGSLVTRARAAEPAMVRSGVSIRTIVLKNQVLLYW